MSGFALVAVNSSAACYKGDWHLESLSFSLKFSAGAPDLTESLLYPPVV